MRERELYGPTNSPEGRTYHPLKVARSVTGSYTAQMLGVPQPDRVVVERERERRPSVLRMREGKDGGGKGPLIREDESLTLATANDQVVFE